MSLEAFEPIGQARDDLGLRAVLHHEGDGAGVVWLYVAGNDIVNLGWIMMEAMRSRSSSLKGSLTVSMRVIFSSRIR